MQTVYIYQGILSRLFAVENSGTVIPLCDFHFGLAEIPLYIGIRWLIQSRVTPAGVRVRMRVRECAKAGFRLVSDSDLTNIQQIKNVPMI